MRQISEGGNDREKGEAGSEWKRGRERGRERGNEYREVSE